MPRSDLSDDALTDIADIVDYTNTQWGAAQANRYVDSLEARFAQLAEFPFMGKDRSDVRQGLRSFPLTSHVVYYEPKDFGVLIVRVLHSSRDPRQALK
ncbi:MAG: type II toxin-antitoxin system RelE/ParE family toxin [Alphaproteobacteria bacterium]